MSMLYRRGESFQTAQGGRTPIVKSCPKIHRGLKSTLIEGT